MLYIDEAKNNFKSYKEKISNYTEIKLSESDTRSKILDEMFITVLGWDESEIRREGYTQAGYYDYLFACPSFKFIVEAKKSLEEFKLPKRNKTVTLNNIYKENAEVVKQIRGYLGEVGLQYGIITNGKQFVIGKFITSDGTLWTANKCLIFDSLEDIDDRFVEFYNCLSKDSIIENSGFDFLKEEETKAQIVTSNIPSKDGELIRNSLSSALTPLINDLFGEIYKYNELDDKILIEHCFVENEEIKKNKSDIEKLFADKPRTLNEIIPGRNTKNLAESIKSEIGNDVISSKNINPPKPIIIVGSKGAGKTTFINYLFKLSFGEDFLKTRPYVYIDFRSYTENDFLNIDEKIINDTLSYLYDRYAEYELYSLKVLKRIYIHDIHKKDASTWAYNKLNDQAKYNEVLNLFLEQKQDDYQNHFIKLSEYLIRERGQRFCLIIDNADQFEMDVQRKAFLFAQSINIKAKCAVIISLREGYYYAWRNKPPFDAFASNVYHVTAPPYREVLKRRIEYALQNFNLSGRTIGIVGSSLRVDYGNDSLRDFILSVENTLFVKENSKMLEFLEETTYPNIREGLEIFKSFLLSGHTNVDQYIMRQQATTKSENIVPIWEFVKAIALENKKYYNHTVSRIFNVFYPVEGSNSHFLKLKILYYLRFQLDTLGYKEKYTSIRKIVDDFSQANYKVKIIMAELNLLLRSSLVEDEDTLSDKDETFQLVDNSNLSISLKGNYYINVLVPSFAYFDLLLQDTPIFSEEHYSKIKANFPLTGLDGKRNVSKRALVVEVFVDYLKGRELRETVESDIVPTKIMQDILVNGLQEEVKRLSQYSY